MANLVLTRHGVTKFNQEPKRFTGFTDVELPPEGQEQARLVGKKLRNKRYQFDIAYTSWLKRSWSSLQLILEELQLPDLPVIKHPFLNERHYGDLQGHYHQEMINQYSEQQVYQWRRGYSTRPPNGESLQDVVWRTQYYLNNEIIPQLKNGKNVLVCGHGNSNRAIVKQLEDISDQDIVNREIPWDKALIYSFDKQGKFSKITEL